MVNTNDKGSLADRTRLVVPRIHESVWAPSNRQQSTPRQDIAAQGDVVVKHSVASEVVKPVVLLNQLKFNTARVAMLDLRSPTRPSPRR